MTSLATGSGELLARPITALWQALPVLVTLVVVIAVLIIADRILMARHKKAEPSNRFGRQVVMLGLTAVGVIAVVLSLPVGESTRGQLIGLLGLVLSAAIALSSTTLIGNAMAGLMLRAVGNLRVGDFVEAGGHFGRVSERGLLHVEIQSEDRDLITLPNTLLVSNPVKVVRSSGTIVSATVSLGYDVPRASVEALLVRAVGEAGLADPFVQILELGDFSITYRAAGFLAEVKHVLSTRTRLRKAMLDALHAENVEIVSPAFMNQRVLAERQKFVPPVIQESPDAAPTVEPESLVFDKAEAAVARSELIETAEALKLRRDELQKERDAAEGDARQAVELELARLELRAKALDDALEKNDSDIAN